MLNSHKDCLLYKPVVQSKESHVRLEAWAIDMPQNVYKVAEARARFSELLSRAQKGEEVVIARGGLPVARLAPVRKPTTREAAPLAHLELPDDLFDSRDDEQSAIDAGDFNDALGIWRGPPENP